MLGSRLLYVATVLVVASLLLTRVPRLILRDVAGLSPSVTWLVVGSLLTPVACLLLGLARYAAQQRVDELSGHRRPSDGGLSYERVDSVSSMVDSQRHHMIYQDVMLVEDMTVI